MIETKPESSPPVRRYRGSSADERRDARRRQLIEAAIRLYGQDGYRNVTVEAVCAAAGLTKRYFYETFANSEALLIAGFETVVRWLMGEIRHTGNDIADPLARGRAKLAAYYEGIRLQPSSARVFLVEITGVSAEVDAVFAKSLDEFASLTLETIDPNGVSFAGRDPLLRRAVTGGVHNTALAWIAEDYASPIERVVDVALKVCLLLADDPADPFRNSSPSPSQGTSHA
jgi:AcrR family transcriptional regulator